MPTSIANEEETLEEQQEEFGISEFIKQADEYSGEFFEDMDMNEILENAIKGEVDNQTLFKKCVYFIELLMGGALFGCSISSVALSTHLLASILYLVGASLIFIRYILRTYFEHSGVFRVITRILFGIAMISIISSIFFY